MLGLVSGFIAGQEWIIIIVLAAVLIFGAKKIPELAKTFCMECYQKNGDCTNCNSCS